MDDEMLSSLSESTRSSHLLMRVIKVVGTAGLVHRSIEPGPPEWPPGLADTVLSKRTVSGFWRIFLVLEDRLPSHTMSSTIVPALLGVVT